MSVESNLGGLGSDEATGFQRSREANPSRESPLDRTVGRVDYSEGQFVDSRRILDKSTISGTRCGKECCIFLNLC